MQQLGGFTSFFFFDGAVRDPREALEERFIWIRGRPGARRHR
jgi:hypothetical protein